MFSTNFFAFVILLALDVKFTVCDLTEYKRVFETTVEGFQRTTYATNELSSDFIKSLEFDEKFLQLTEDPDVNKKVENLENYVRNGIKIGFAPSLSDYQRFKEERLQRYEWAVQNLVPLNVPDVTFLMPQETKTNSNLEKVELYNTKLYFYNVSTPQVDISSTDAELFSLFKVHVSTVVQTVVLCGQHVLSDSHELMIHGSFCYQLNSVPYDYTENVVRTAKGTFISELEESFRYSNASYSYIDFSDIELQRTLEQVLLLQLAQNYLPAFSERLYALTRIDKNYLGMIESIGRLYRNRILNTILDLYRSYLISINDKLILTLPGDLKIKLFGFSKLSEYDTDIDQKIGKIKGDRLAIDVVIDTVYNQDDTMLGIEFDQAVIDVPVNRLMLKFTLSLTSSGAPTDMIIEDLSIKFFTNEKIDKLKSIELALGSQLKQYINRILLPNTF